MNNQLYGTRLYVNFSHLAHNIRQLTKNHTMIIAMVKANAYGHGDLVMTKKMEDLGVNYFGVADFEEGVLLRKSGIKRSIMVMNPGINNVDTIIEHNLDIVIYNKILLNKVIQYSKEKNTRINPIPIHLKINTGMNRWGFNMSELPEIISSIKNEKSIKIISLYSHLSSAQNIKDDLFTSKQINKFIIAKELFSSAFNYDIFSHIFNSKGLIRFGKKITEFSHSRAGIALYGGLKSSNLKSVSELKCTISQIRHIGPNEYVGYNNNFISQKKIKIGILPFGYADGLQRSWGNGVLRFYYEGRFLPTIGDISMDSCMIDISSIENINVGDEIIYFGLDRPIWDLAEEINTIPYEIMATLSRRIKRIYT